MSLVTIVFSMALRVEAQTTPAPSPTPKASPTPSLEKEFFKNVLGDQKAIWTAPLHLERGDMKWAIPYSIGVMSLFTTDRITGDEIAESDRQVAASRAISYAGSAYGFAAVAGGFYLIGRATHNSRARETGILSAEAAIDGLIVSAALKGVTQRTRPQTGSERSEFFDGGNSFPSGHSVQAWSMATIVANEYHDHRLVQVTAYALASAVSISRFTGGRHYISDVLVGSSLGFGIGRYVYRTHHRDASSDDDSTKVTRWPVITPEYDRHGHQYGVGLKWSW